MLTEVSWEDAIGKTLKSIGASICNQQCVLVFEDGTYTTLGIDRGYDAGDETIIEERLYWLSFGDESIVELGIASEDEVNAERDRIDAEFERNNIENLRHTFAVLKERLEKAEGKVS